MSQKKLKVLFYVPKIYEPEKKLFIGDKSGLAIYVHDIAEGIGNVVDVYVLTYKFVKQTRVKNINYVSHTKKDFITHLSMKNIILGIKRFLFVDVDLKNRTKNLFWSCDLGCFKDAIKQISPDLVHLHGANPEIIEQINICKQFNIPFVITLHGFIGELENKGRLVATKESEKLVLEKGEKEHWPITVVSSGTKNRMMRYYNISGKNIRIILNGTNLKISGDNHLCKESIYKRYGIPFEKKHIICIGTICERKNQFALIESWKMLELNIRDQFVILFAGVDATNGEFEKRIQEAGLENQFYMCGYVPKDDLSAYYSCASLNVIVSKDEGFGLSIIEAMRYGVPTLTFSDLDASTDVFNTDAMVLVERTKEQLAEGLRLSLSKQWNRERIIEISEQYTMNNTCERYYRFYREIISQQKEEVSCIVKTY